MTSTLLRATFPLMPFLLFLVSLFVGVARAEDATGILKVRSNVDGAEVYVDGALLGKAPITKYLAVGPHQLRVVADRYDPFVRRVELVADKTMDVQANLIPGGGTVEFAGPAGAHVFLANVDKGVAPIRLPSPAAGKVAWRVEALGAEPAEGTIEVVPGRNYLIDAKLESSAGVVVVHSKPEGARVRLDGKDVGVTPLKLKDVPAGKHGVEIALDGYARAYRALDTSSGNRGVLDLTLKKGGGALTIAGAGPSAKLYVNDVAAAQGADLRLEGVEAGKLKLRLEDGASIATSTVSLADRAQVTLRVRGDHLEAPTPWYRHWAVWTGVGAGVTAGTVAAISSSIANQPAPPPEGTTVVSLP